MKSYLKIVLISLLTICGPCLASQDNGPSDFDQENSWVNQVYKNMHQVTIVGTDLLKQGYNLAYEQKQHILLAAAIGGVALILSDTVEDSDDIPDETDSISPCYYLFLLSLLGKLS